ncbi:hypothetical protein [Pseudodesulfovibrio methanolicus]|uniref:DUF4203 domain-containing protein n=1 Tax=Pseudodesulfovibrio methanolicus TaxID=3126690 RepID=A0ABZ2IZ58_9BACT
MELNALLQQGGILFLTVMLAGGTALNYFGLRLQYIALFLAGALFGTFLGSGGSILSGHDGLAAVLITLFTALACGLLTVFLTRFTVFILGGFIGALLAASTGHGEPLILALAGFACGTLTAALLDLGIILITSFSGSLLMFHGLVNLHSLATDGHTASVSGATLNYAERLIEAVSRDGLQGLDRTFQGDGWLLGLLFLSGALVQFGVNARRKKPAPVRGMGAGDTGPAAADTRNPTLSGGRYPEEVTPGSQVE